MLIACLTGQAKNKIYNSQLLRVVEWTTHIRLECTESGTQYEVTPAWCSLNLRLAHAIVYSCIQARTCRGTVCLWGVDHRRMSRRLLCVGLSRATQASNVWIEPKGP